MRTKFVPASLTPSLIFYIYTEARPLCVLYSLRDGSAIHAALQRLSKIFRRRWSRSLRWSSPSGPDGVPRPARHNHSPQSNTVRLPFVNEKSPPLKQQKKNRSEGNLVNELDGKNPTALLISAIEKSIAKDDEFYLGVLRDQHGGELWQLHHIMAGGPSRGTMALETEMAPAEGTSVQVNALSGRRF